ncbi:spiro-SPASM protein [Brachyspira pilosicoli]|uniref:spiro-SPASM protein n=1 Tax=Brachyspira pilosicoli TaxID=52584 RepID=UPI003003E113
MEFIIIVDESFENEYSKIFLEDFGKKIELLKQELNCDVKNINYIAKGAEDYLSNIYKETENYDNIIYIPNNMPMFNIDETVKLTKIHKENISYFTYGENYPEGIIPFIIRRNAFEKLFNCIKTKNINITENAIKDIVFIDPNFFEIEILVSEYDMRYYRVSLFANSKRNALIISKLIKYENYDKITKAIREYASLRRTLPSYIEIDINNRQNLINKNLLSSNAFTNEINKEEKNLTIEEFKTIYNKLSDFCDDFHLSIGSYYEPLLNKDVFDILEYAISNKNVNVYLETNAILLDEEKAKKLLFLQEKNNNLHVIIHLDTIEQNVFNTIYKEDCLKTILSNIDYYFIREPKNTYLQITKQKDNFDYLASYYKYFDKYKIEIIMQKYYTYRGLVENKKIGDMTPLINVGCWHLARDLFIDAYGDVYICRFDINKEKCISSIYKDTLENIWKELESYYKENILTGLDFCKNCDEWYLFNF